MRKAILFSITCLFLANFLLAQIEKNYWKREIKGIAGLVIETSFSVLKDTVTNEFKKGIRTDSTIIEFNSSGNQTKEASYLSNGVLLRKCTNRYDLWGNMIQLTAYNPDGVFQWKFAYKYNERGNQIEEDWSNANGIHNLTNKKFGYDLILNKIEEIQSDKDGRVFKKMIYQYDNYGKVIESKSYDKDYIMNGRATYTYDKYGNTIETKVYTQAESLFEKTTCTYKYDDKLNWIERIQYKNDKPYLITERRIIY